MSEKRAKRKEQTQINEWKMEEKETMRTAESFRNPDATRHHLILDFTVVFLWLEKSHGKVNKRVLRGHGNKGCPSDSNGSTSCSTV